MNMMFTADHSKGSCNMAPMSAESVDFTKQSTGYGEFYFAQLTKI